MRETIDWPIFAMKLKQMRVAAGFSQRELAAHSAVGAKTISSFESGHRTNAISFAQLMDLAWACGYTVPEFVTTKPFGFRRSKRAIQRERAAYQRRYRRSGADQASEPPSPPKRGITIFRSSDFLQSSLGEARR